jgi:L-2-hydroxyglutarate oxidase LhgO
MHASGRNSGVLHAGFYYSADSLKARFTREGNQRMKEFCRRLNLHLNECGKVVVASDENELDTLHELHERGLKNGVDIKLVDKEELEALEPNARTCRYALHSPSTATVNPGEVCRKLRDKVVENGTALHLDTKYLYNFGNRHIHTSRGEYSAGKVINCAGLYADKIASQFGFARKYLIVPFKGIYLKYSGSDHPVKTNIYPVPNLKNPFLGVHYTVTADGTIKIGPTAIPAFWRENYEGLKNFDPVEMAQIIAHETRLFVTDSFGFRSLAMEEFRKYSAKRLASLAKHMVNSIDSTLFDTWSTPGIRAQLLNRETLELVQDFVVEADEHSVHILNAVSPAFTCAPAFAEWVVEKYT